MKSKVINYGIRSGREETLCFNTKTETIKQLKEIKANTGLKQNTIFENAMNLYYVAMKGSSGLQARF